MEARKSRHEDAAGGARRLCYVHCLVHRHNPRRDRNHRSPDPLVPRLDPNVPLARMLFWFFGHPLVYFWLLPAYVMYYTMLPKLTGGKLYSDFAGRFTFLWLIAFSAPVGIHHQYHGVSTTWKFVHTFFTMLVAIPSLVTAFTLAASMICR